MQTKFSADAFFRSRRRVNKGGISTSLTKLVIFKVIFVGHYAVFARIFLVHLFQIVNLYTPIKLFYYVKPYKPSILFVGHR